MTVVLVEGSGDANALPIVLQRSGKDREIRCIDMGGKSNIVRAKSGFEGTVRRQLLFSVDEFIVLLDRDRTFAPYTTLHEEELDMKRRAGLLEREIGRAVKVLWAIRSFESWLIGGMRTGDQYCGLRKLAKPVPGDTQASPHHPKEWIKEHLTTKKYNESTQVCLSKSVDWKLAQKRNNSLRDFLKAFSASPLQKHTGTG